MLTLLSWQEEAWSRLPVNDALPHALLLHGPVGIGKRLFAERLAARLVCEEGIVCGTCRACRLVASGNHPDILPVTPAAGKTEITVEEVRALNHFAVLTPHMGPRRVVVITSADRLNRSAANALLKTLEEPASGGYLVLVSDNPARLLPTVRSRCQRIVLARPPEALALRYLEGRQTAHPNATLALAHGAPLAAEALPQDILETGLRLLKTLDAVGVGEESAAQASEAWHNVDLTLGLGLLLDILEGLAQIVLGEDKPSRFGQEWHTRLQATAIRLDLHQVFGIWDEALELYGFIDAPLDRRLIWDRLFLRFEPQRA